MAPYQVVEQAVVVHQEALSGTQNITQLALFNEDGTPFSGEGISLTTPLTSLVVPQNQQAITASDTLIGAIGKLQGIINFMFTVINDIGQEFDTRLNDVTQELENLDQRLTALE